MSRLAIFGTGGMGREALDLQQALDAARQVVFVEDHPRGAVNGVECIAPDALRMDDEVVVAVGMPEGRRSVVERLGSRSYASLIAKTAKVSPFSQIADGAVICEFALINSGSIVGRHFQANCFAQLSHDCRVGDFVTFSPQVSCNGWVDIGDEVFVGAGAIIRNGNKSRRLMIGAGAIIGMGAVVTKDVHPGQTVVGNPAREVSRK